MDPSISQHNIYCPLDLASKRRHQVFTSMSKGLRENFLMHVIYANPEIHSCWIEEFWTKAEAVMDGDSITTKVAGKCLKITKADVIRALNIKDAPYHYFKRTKKDELQDFVTQIGYDAKWTTFENKHLPPYWKFLFHIIANYVYELRGGVDKLRTD
ncbi:uncharacterized protein LOC143601879 [Bidens hawaiensis]|uniref:uncharacterized protein LOC143601879 n=1 Tax=Bidens hawaiensis TaxID=980011 RepID=UPI0040495534